MPHTGSDIKSWNSSIGVPEKGRNAGIALREELERDDIGEILDILNGKGKKAAKTGEGFTEIWKEVGDYDFIELRDTGRNFPRSVFTELVDSGEKVSSYSESPLEQDFDRFYQGLDRIIEENYSFKKISRGFEDIVTEIAQEEGYRLTESYGDEVKWGVMNTSLSVEPETVLLPAEFKNIGKAVAENYWENDPDYLSFQEYREECNMPITGEEEILAETPENVSGAYMFVSGDTAEEAGLEYKQLPGFTSKLGVFEKNQYKNSEENPF